MSIDKKDEKEYFETFSKIKKTHDKKMFQLEKYERLNNLKYQLEWVKRQLEYVTFASRYKLKIPMKRGEVYEFDWGVNVNAEFSHRHYGVIMADSDENNPLVTICPLKTNRFGAHPKSDILLGFIPEVKTECQTIAVINQIRSLDKMRVYSKMIIAEKSSVDKIITLNELQMEKITDAFVKLYVNNCQLDDEENDEDEIIDDNQVERKA